MLMLIPILILSKAYRQKLWKSFPIAFILTITGTISTLIWFFIENFHMGGWSFYGAVFIVPIVFVLIAKLFRIPYGDLMDICAPAECMMLVIMKFQCMMDGCCRGRVMYTTADGVAVAFPSQAVELVNALLVFAVLMILAMRKNNRGTIYLWYLIIYGCTRFVLNFFRSTTPVIFGLSYGTIWSICSVAVGAALLVLIKKKTVNQRSSKDV